MSLPVPFYRYRSELEAELRSAIGNDTSPLYTMMRYHLGWTDERGRLQDAPSGKLLRSTLCLLACETAGGDWHMALPAAAAVELAHNFTLIHDDIQDRSKERRHRPTVWRIWGLAQGINAGDGMWALSQLALFRLEQRGVSREKMAAASRLLSETCLKLCEGQYLDLSYQNRARIGVKDYLKMIRGKTAQLFRCSLTLGALLGTDDPVLISHFGSFGADLGLAFQIHDDLLGVCKDEKVTGKSSYTDIIEKKKTLPIIYAQEEAKGEERERLSCIYSKTRITAKDVSDVLQILKSTGAQSHTEGFRQRYYRRALQEVKKMRLPPRAEADLKEVATFMLEQT